jgi:hypothetical protein
MAMRYVMAILLFTTSVRADCTAPIFPPQTKSLEFLQTTTSDIGELEAKLSWTKRRAHRDRIEWTETFVKESGTASSTAVFACSEEGITPVAAGTTFTGVQYGYRLEPGHSWTWSWAGTGISSSYVYRVVKVEQVTVPAGTFDAVRVDYSAKTTSETRGELPEIKGTIWIAPGIGLVKQVEDDPALGLVADHTHLELIARK